MTRAAIFDLDGTIVDSAPGITLALKRVCVLPNLIQLERVRELVAHSVEALISEMLKPDDEQFAGALRSFREAYAENPCCPDDLFPGVERALEECRRAGFSIGICTNKPQELAEIVISRLGIAHLIDVVVGSASSRPKKPHPEMLFRTMQLMRVEKAVFVGDSSIDAETSKRAQIPFVYVSFGYGCVGDSGIRATILNSFDCLPKVLDEIWSAGLL